MFTSRDISYDNNAYNLKRLLYESQKIYRPVKRVQFKGLGPIEDDDKKKKIMPKDAPKGVEETNIVEEEAK